jgi:hypothetical protein
MVRTLEELMMEAVETTYAGCRFRSRLEARWAHFMDLMGVPWQYEYQGFDLPSGRYLPDFRLPEAKVYFEVKGSAPNLREITLGLELAREMSAYGWRYRMLVGDLPREPVMVRGAGLAAVPCLSAVTDCALVPPPRQGWRDQPPLWVNPRTYAETPLEHWLLRDSYWHANWWTSASLEAALTRARSARFGHGGGHARSLALQSH